MKQRTYISSSIAGGFFGRSPQLSKITLVAGVIFSMAFTFSYAADSLSGGQAEEVTRKAAEEAAKKAAVEAAKKATEEARRLAEEVKKAAQEEAEIRRLRQR